MLATLLASDQVTSHAAAETAFTVYDNVRRERAAWLVQSSRHIGNTYEWLASGIEDDLDKVEREIKERNGIIADFDVEASCKAAIDELNSRMQSNN